MDSACKKFLSRYPELHFISDTGKIHCSLSGHEMPCRIDVLKSYVSGKKFTKLKAHHDFDFSRLEPFLIPSKKRKYQLFCALTNHYVNRKPDEVKGHIAGRRYKQAMERYNSGEVALFQERLKGSKTMETANAISEEEVQASEQETHDRTSSQDGSASGFWTLPDSDSDEAGEQVKEEDSSYQEEEKDVAVEEKSSLSSKKGRKRKRLTQALATVKKRKQVRSFEPKANSRSKKIKNTKQ